MTAYAIFGTSRHLKVTASSSVAIMSASVVVAIAAGNASAYVPLSAGLALMVGIILLVAGAARLGFLSQFLAASVVTGFVIGLAVTITVGQIPALLGIPSVSGTIIEKLVADRREPRRARTRYTAALGIGSLVGILVLRRIAPRIPGALVALVVGIVLSSLLDLPEKGVDVVGEVATGIPLPSLPSIGFGDIVFLLTGRVRDRLPRARRIDRGRALVRGPPRLRRSTRTRSSSPSARRTPRPACSVGSRSMPASASRRPARRPATGPSSSSLVTAGADPRHGDRPRPDLREPAAVGPVRDRHRLGR